LNSSSSQSVASKMDVFFFLAAEIFFDAMIMLASLPLPFALPFVLSESSFGSEELFSSGGRCYDHNFLRFLTIFGKKMGVFL
jgi:hypothetical protein